MNPPSQCVGPNDPAFIVALAAGLIAALLLSSVLGRLGRPRRGPPRPRLYRDLTWFAMLAAVFFGTIILMEWLYSWEHPGVELCTTLVWRWFFLPPVVLFVSGALWGIRERKLHALERLPGKVS